MGEVIVEILNKSSMSYQDEEDPTFEDMRIYLSNFQSGRIILHKHEETGLATLCFDNKPKKNAISGQMMIDFRDHLLELREWSVGKAVILYGEGNFCSGGDLEFAMKSGNMKGAQYISKWMHDCLTLLHCLPLISVCLLSGPSLGGGAEISVYCDYLIAADDVHFGFIHGKLEIIPAYGGASRLIKKLGHEKGLELLLTSKIIKAPECLAIGLVEKIVPKESAYEDTVTWTLERVKHHYTITRALKLIAIKASYDSLEKSMKFERDVFCPFWGSERNKSALRKKLKHL